MRAAVLLAIFATVVLISIGCDGRRHPTATEPQAENQRAKTADERVEYLIGLLKIKNPKKNAQAARTLGKLGVQAEKAIPDLEKLVGATNDPKVKEAAITAIGEIQAASELKQ